MNAPTLDRIPIFFKRQMQAQVVSLSPSAHKPLAALESWLALGVPLEIIRPAALTIDDIKRAHDPDYVEGILSCRIANGFYTRDPHLAASLPFTSGAMLAAAREAIRNGLLAVAPCCGFHHASYASNLGFCTFNGLMIAALALEAEGLVDRVGILDFDHHYGDGTDNIIDTLRVPFITHFTAGEYYHAPSQASGFLQRIPEIVGSMQDCDLILYQAGADPHVEDPLGGWLTTEQLAERDRLVFEIARTLSIPVAWNLAGGYQSPLRKVLDIHDNTMRSAAAVYLTKPEKSVAPSREIGCVNQGLEEAPWR
jgi:acetoin utilization deacetylase AcuC-like enzyme